jgi:hypothetical protein
LVRFEFEFRIVLFCFSFTFVSLGDSRLLVSWCAGEDAAWRAATRTMAGVGDLVSIPMSSMASLDPDEDGEAVDQREYISMIGSLLYLTATRPDIQFTVGLCVRFQSSPRSSHCTTVQRVFMYLKHTPEFGICYSASSSLDLVGFSDADFVGCGIDRKSTSGTCHFLGSSLVCWSSQKQSSVAQSTTEAEYVAAAARRFFG